MLDQCVLGLSNFEAKNAYCFMYKQTVRFYRVIFGKFYSARRQCQLGSEQHAPQHIFHCPIYCLIDAIKAGNLTGIRTGPRPSAGQGFRHQHIPAARISCILPLYSHLIPIVSIRVLGYIRRDGERIYSFSEQICEFWLRFQYLKQNTDAHR